MVVINDMAYNSSDFFHRMGAYIGILGNVLLLRDKVIVVQYVRRPAGFHCNILCVCVFNEFQCVCL